MNVYPDYCRFCGFCMATPFGYVCGNPETSDGSAISSDGFGVCDLFCRKEKH